MTNYMETLLGEFLFRSASMTKPSYYIGLFTAMPNDAGGGTEVATGSYARVQLDPSNSNYVGSGGVYTNNVAIIYPTPTANWGTIVGFAFFDAPTAGNMQYWAPLTTTRNVQIGDFVSFNVATLELELN